MTRVSNPKGSQVRGPGARTPAGVSVGGASMVIAKMNLDPPGEGGRVPTVVDSRLALQVDEAPAGAGCQGHRDDARGEAWPGHQRAQDRRGGQYGHDARRE